MTIDNRIAIAALIISFTSPFVKALAERWIAKPVAIPEENKPTNQNQPKSRFSRLVMSKGFELFLALLTLASVVPLAWAPLSGFNVLVMAFGVSSFAVQFMMKPRVNRLSNDVDVLIALIDAQQAMIQATTKATVILSQPEPSQNAPDEPSQSA